MTEQRSEAFQQICLDFIDVLDIQAQVLGHVGGFLLAEDQSLENFHLQGVVDFSA